MRTSLDESKESIDRVAAESTRLAQIARKMTELAAVAQEMAKHSSAAEIARLDAAVRAAADHLPPPETIARQVLVAEEAARLLGAGTSGMYGVSAQEASKYPLAADEIAAINAAIQESMRYTPTLDAIASQVREQQAAAAEMARDLLAEEPRLRNLVGVQAQAVRQSLEMAAFELQDRKAVLRWLDMKQPDLGMRTALEVIQEGHADILAATLSAALKGIPS